MKSKAAVGMLLFSFFSHGNCQKDEHRQFDFWLGQWQVVRDDGQLAGSNQITKGYNGCVIKERYQAGSGFHGESVNIFDVTTGRWHQTWVDSSGLLLQLQGGWEDGEMVLQGDRQNLQGVKIQDKITWRVNGDGSVRQLWQSKVAGGDWQITFDGHYQRQHQSQ